MDMNNSVAMGVEGKGWRWERAIDGIKGDGKIKIKMAKMLVLLNWNSIDLIDLFGDNKHLYNIEYSKQ